MIKKLLRTAGVGYLYFPHLWLIRAVGPYGALAIARAVACGHWLLTYFGAEHRTLAALRALRPRFESTAGAGTLMRRYLITKQQNFTEWHLFPTRRGRRFVQQTYTELAGREYLDEAIAEGRGVILLVFHFGLVRMAIPALEANGYHVTQHVYRGTTYGATTFSWMANAAMKQLANTETASGLKIVYHQPIQSLITLLRCLRRGEIVGVNGDGMMGEDFVEVPFLQGTVRLPAGPAQLAAQSKAPVVPLFVLPERFARHRLIFHPASQVESPAPEAIRQATSAYAALLEQYVRRYPWAWWTWRRLRIDQLGAGRVQYDIQALPNAARPLEVRRAPAS